MSFIWPIMLILLLFIPLWVWMYRSMQGQRQQRAASYGSLGLLQHAGQAPGRKRHIPALLFLAGMSLLLIALARPQAVVSMPRIEGIVMLVFDVSHSMAADDVAPSRLEAAKVIARKFIEQQPSTVQIGIVAFSDGGFTIQAPSNDQAQILAAVERITPQRGTSLGQGILTALTAFDVQAGQAQPGTTDSEASSVPAAAVGGGSRVIVLLSDGENNARPDPLEAAQAAADRGIHIDTVGIGTPKGSTLEIEGFKVHTQLEELVLQDIADLTGAHYYQASTEDDLRSVYDNLDLQLVIRAQYEEITAPFAGVGVLLLLTGGLLSLFWFGRFP